MRPHRPSSESAPSSKSPSRLDPRATIELGIVTRPHGLRGEVHVRLHNLESTVLEGIGAVLVRRPGGEQSAEPVRLVVETARPTPDGSWVVAFEGIVTREDAESLRGGVVSAPRGELPEPGESELYVEDLAGLEAVDPAGRALGTVREVYSNGAQEVLVVATGRGDVDVPFVDAHVGAVDVENGRIVILDLESLVPEG